MATENIEQVLTVFQGIATRNPELTIRNMNPVKYVPHNPHVGDGIKGLKAYVENLPPENHHLTVLRTFQDGHYVFTQEEGSILGQNIFFDVFRFEEDQIVEHWVFSAKAAPPNKSGHTQSDGPTQVNASENTQKNKARLLEYYETVHIKGDHSKIPEYVSGDYCIRHEPDVEDGIAAFAGDVEVLTQSRTIDEVKFVLGDGDFVFMAAKGTHDRAACVYVDLYRIEHEKIVEHWGFSENVPPEKEWKNNNGML